MPIIPQTQKAEAGGREVQDQPQQFIKTPVSKKRAGLAGL